MSASGLPPLEFCSELPVFRHDGRWPCLLMGWGFRVRVPDVGKTMANLAHVAAFSLFLAAVLLICTFLMRTVLP